MTVPLTVTEDDLVHVGEGDIVRILTNPPGNSLGIVVDVEIGSHSSENLWTGPVCVTVLTDTGDLTSFRVGPCPIWGTREISLVLKF